MAKDGTLRGGVRTGQGRPKKALSEKMAAGNPGGRKLEVLDIPDGFDTPELEGVDMPPVKEYLSATQRDGKELCAADVFRRTWMWLKKLKCERMVNPQLIEQYAMSVARWLQCEQAITEYGFLGKHPTTKTPIQSPYVAMSQNYMKQTNIAWTQIFQIVKENCTVDYSGPNPEDDVMERLLRARKGN